MIRKFLFASLFIWAVGAVANYDQYITSLKKEAQVADKVAGGVYAALWPTTVDLSGVLPNIGLPEIGFDPSNVDWGRTFLLYVVLSYGLSIPLLKNVISDDTYERTRKGNTTCPIDNGPCVISFCWLLSPFILPLMLAYGVAMKGAKKDREPAGAKA